MQVEEILLWVEASPGVWYDKIDSFLMKLYFTSSNADPNLYFKVDREKTLILVLYVDSLFLTGVEPLIH